MNRNEEEKSMCSRTTPMNLNQRTNKKMRKAHRSIRDKGIQKHTTLDKDGVQMRDGLDGMTRNLEKDIMSLNQLVRGDLRIRTPLDRCTSNKWHNFIKGRRLIKWINRILDQWHLKSNSHYWRSKGVLITPYPTTHKSVGIIEVDREVRVEVFDQGSRRRMINILMFLRRFSFSYAS